MNQGSLTPHHCRPHRYAQVAFEREQTALNSLMEGTTNEVPPSSTPAWKAMIAPRPWATTA